MTVWKKQVYSGICVCGHAWAIHHGSMVANPEYIKQTGEDRIAGECLFYGSNEVGGMMEDADGTWIPHCFRYVDAKDPERTEKLAQRP